MSLTDWLDQRTGHRTLVRGLLNEPVPGGARWRYVWGSTLVFVFAVQVITGILLMTVYSPSATTAWSSVWYIQMQMSMGWLIRGMHHFGSQAMIILLPLHMLQVVFARAYRAPREVNWWLGLGLLGIVLALGLTGYLLPWDQKGYWATQVATNIIGLTPLVGSGLQKLLIGGSEYGHLTLTRFYTLHVVVLPAAFVLLLIAHLALFRRHGVTHGVSDFRFPLTRDAAELPGDAYASVASQGFPISDSARGLKRESGMANRKSETGDWAPFWPDQLLKDSIACLLVLAGLVIASVYTHLVLGDALLDAPADPAAANYPARPEWYFLFLFQLLKYFEGPNMEMVGAILVPAAVVLVLFVIPLLDKVLWGWLAHFLAVAFTMAVLGGTGWLTVQAFRDDRNPPAAVLAQIQEKQGRGEPLTGQDLAHLRARQFNQQRVEAQRIADRALALADQQGIPPAGPLELLAHDPLIRGPQLFAAHCAACHRFHGHDGLGQSPPEPPTASDLGGFASRAWIRGLLEDPMDPRYFGLMKNDDGDPAHTRMARWLEDMLEEHETPEDRRTLLADFDAAAAYLEDESLHPGRLAGLGGTSDASDDEIDLGDTGSTTDGEGAGGGAVVATASRDAHGSASAGTRATPSSADADHEDLIRRGRLYFTTTCMECHSYDGERFGTQRGPEMRGYGSPEWIARMIADPSHPSLYGSTGREPAQMPSFSDTLTEHDRLLIARWLHQSRDIHGDR